MSGKACTMCLRDECDRCHDISCVCCGAGALAFPQTASDYDLSDDGRVEDWPEGLSY